jgi:uncharacterized phosphatase
MTRFFIIRHGETVWNADHNRYSGRTDVELSDKGRLQAEQAAALLKGSRFNRIYASTLIRARETAKPIAANHSLELQTDERLVEADFGQWEGKHSHIVQSEHAEQWKAWVGDAAPEVRAGGTGETRGEIAERMTSFITDSAKAYPEERIAVVSHSTAIRLLVASILGMPLYAFRRLSLSNAGVTIIDTDKDGKCTVLQFNGGLDELYM